MRTTPIYESLCDNFALTLKPRVNDLKLAAARM
jgi:hypothetical protein